MRADRFAVDDSVDVNAAALDAARTLAAAIGNSGIFRRFEAAQEAFQADKTAQKRLRAYQTRQEALRVSAMWGWRGTRRAARVGA